MVSPRKIYLTDQDLQRLRELVSDPENHSELQPLADELDRAIVVLQELIPPNVVTMNSKVRFEDLDTREVTEATLVYPQDVRPGKNRISITTPVGTALIGLTVGDTVEWSLPGGRVQKLKILGVLYQPEASGDWDL